MTGPCPPAPDPHAASETPFRRRLRERGLQRFAELDGTRVSFAEAGEGPPVLLVHGLGGSAYDWRANLEPLARGGLRVLAVELLGAGLSDKPANGDYSVPGLAALLRQLADVLGLGRIGLVGNSLGGAVALAFAQAWPDRLRSLVVIDPACYREPLPYYLRLCRIRGLPHLGLSLLPDRPLVRGILHGLFGDPDHVTDADIDEYTAELRQPRRKEAMLATFDHLLFDDPAAFERGLRAIRVPTLILWGARDRLLPAEQAQRLNADIERSILRILPRAGHVPHQEFPDRVNRLLSRFLKFGARRRRARDLT